MVFHVGNPRVAERPIGFQRAAGGLGTNAARTPGSAASRGPVLYVSEPELITTWYARAMARQSEWRRTAVNYVPSPDGGQFHQAKLCDLAQGETITRVRFSYWAGQNNVAVPLAGSGVSMALGIQAYPGNLPTDTPLTSPNADWMWWEWFTMVNEIWEHDTANKLTNTMTNPNPAAERDVKAQRAALEGPMTVWLQTEGFNLTQGYHDLSYGASCLVLLAP